MKAFILLLFFCAQFPANASVEICHRKAQIAFGLVSHYWLKTDTVVAGMGSGRSAVQIGDEFEGPGTKVFVIDHTDQIAETCEETVNHIEDCVNEELEVGKSLGRFTPVNNCQTFVRSVLKKCEKDEYKILKKERMEYRRLANKASNDRILSIKEELRLRELSQKFGL